MMAVRVKGVVQPGGVLEIHLPECPPGTEAEVLVFYESQDLDADSVRPLPSLRGAAKGVFRTPQDADAFISGERDAWEERLRQV